MVWLLSELTEPIVDGDVSQTQRHHSVSIHGRVLDLFLIGLEFVDFIPPAATYIYLHSYMQLNKY